MAFLFKGRASERSTFMTLRFKGLIFQGSTLPETKTNSSPLKIDKGNSYCKPPFLGAMLVFGRGPAISTLVMVAADGGSG